MMTIGGLAAVVLIVIVLVMDWFPEQGSTAADDIDLLYDVLLIASAIVFALVMTVAIYSVIRFRARPGDLGDGVPIHGNTRLEIIWVTIPFLMVTSLAIYGWIVLDDIEAKKKDELRVNVTGQQFAWRFEYPEEKVKSNQLILPKDRPVHFYITSDDVIHSFWVPEFRLKSDAVPGLTTHVRLTPNSIDKYAVVCAELCGIGHSTMRQQVRVVQAPEFDEWVASRQERAEGGEGEAPSEETGKAVFLEGGCGSCHELATADATGTVGPSLEDLATNASKRQPGTSAEEYVEESIVDPTAFVVKGFPGNLMPDDFADQFSPDEIDALVKYLLEVSQ
jgi:cytochrome c oxidase subunit 2